MGQELNKEVSWASIATKKSDFEKLMFAEAYIKQLSITNGKLQSEIHHLEATRGDGKIREELTKKRQEVKQLQEALAKSGGKVLKAEVQELKKFIRFHGLNK